jgi:hypothetical protein
MTSGGGWRAQCPSAGHRAYSIDPSTVAMAYRTACGSFGTWKPAVGLCTTPCHFPASKW